MDTVRLVERLQLEHRHSDGSWSPLQPSPHDAAQIDPERSWFHGTIFRCKTCDEQVVVSTGGEPTPEDVTAH
jgi:hypothetical protein